MEDVASEVQLAVQSLIDTERAPGGMLESLDGDGRVGVGRMPPEKDGSTPYLLFSEPSQSLEFQDSDDHYHRVDLTIAAYHESKAKAAELMADIKGALGPSFENVSIVSAEVVGNVQIRDVVEQGTVTTKEGSHRWAVRWQLEFYTRSPR